MSSIISDIKTGFLEAVGYGCSHVPYCPQASSRVKEVVSPWFAGASQTVEACAKDQNNYCGFAKGYYNAASEKAGEAYKCFSEGTSSFCQPATAFFGKVGVFAKTVTSTIGGYCNPVAEKAGVLWKAYAPQRLKDATAKDVGTVLAGVVAVAVGVKVVVSIVKVVSKLMTPAKPKIVIPAYKLTF